MTPILTDDEIGSCFRFSRFEMCRAVESAILAKLPSLGYIKLKPGQVVAEYEGCFTPNPCPSSCSHFAFMRAGKRCDTNLVEVKK